MCDAEPLEHPREILRGSGLSASRRLGQHFLVSPNVMARILEAARIAPDEVILEIGTGLGRLTRRLAQRAACVVSVEIDRGFCEIAGDRLAGCDNVTLLCGDFLASKHEINPAVTAAVRGARAGRPVKVVSNLPYQISSPAIINLLEWEVPVEQIVVMLQAEVVERLTAAPDTRQYGPLTVFAAYRAEAEELFSVPPSAFWPRPAVRSSLVRLVPRAVNPRAQSYRTFAEAVNRLFQNRRKTLARALRIGWGRARAEAVLERLELEASVRPDKLALRDFVQVADALTATGGEAASCP